ncbi:MAG: hypothetical protein KKA76_07615 [Proteobacteria bacterium]|nr:hypothetical protein [Pseudomonadota bacterium]
MSFQEKIIPCSPYPPRILPGLTVQRHTAFSSFGDEGTKNPIRPHGKGALGDIGVSRVGVYISSLTPYIDKKKKEKESNSFILLAFFFGLFWGGSKNNPPRIVPVCCLSSANQLKS